MADKITHKLKCHHRPPQIPVRLGYNFVEMLRRRCSIILKWRRLIKKIWKWNIVQEYLSKFCFYDVREHFFHCPRCHRVKTAARNIKRGKLPHFCYAHLILLKLSESTKPGGNNCQNCEFPAKLSVKTSTKPAVAVVTKWLQSITLITTTRNGRCYKLKNQAWSTREDTVTDKTSHYLLHQEEATCFIGNQKFGGTPYQRRMIGLAIGDASSRLRKHDVWAGNFPLGNTWRQIPALAAFSGRKKHSTI